MRLGRKRAASPQGDYLELVPRRLVESEAGPDGAIVLLVPRYRDAVFGRLLQPRLGARKRHLRVPLEACGAALWAAVDGRRSVRQLVEAVRAAAPDDQEDLPRRVCLFVQAMVDNGFLALAGFERASAPSAKGLEST